MVDIDEKINKRRARRQFSLNRKRKLCEQWQTSGLKKNQFCKEHNLVPSAFFKWCQELLPQSNKTVNNNWTPVVLKNEPCKEEMITVEMTLPNKMTLRLSLSLSHLNHLLKELTYGT